MHTVEILNKTYYPQAEWNELSARQVIYLCRQLTKKISASLIKKKIAFRFAKIPVILYARRLNRIQQMQIENLYDFLFEKSALTNNPLPSVRIGLRMYYGPEDKCKNIMVDEFVHAFYAYQAFKKTQKPEHLDKLIAILWRPTNPWIRFVGFLNGRDIRAKFNDRKLKVSIKKISAMPEAFKLAALLFWSGFENSLPNDFPLVFKLLEKHSLATESANWPDVIIELSGQKHGKPAEIEQMNFRNFAYILNKQEVDRIKAEKNK